MSWLVPPSRLDRGGAMDRLADFLVGPTATDIGHRLVDLGVGRRRGLLEQRYRSHDLARLAVAALRHLLFDPRLLHRMAAVGRNTFDRGHRILADHAHRHAGGAGRLAVDMDGAGAALLDAAAVFGAG